ncbi:MAG: MAPEG family protein [Novosphingobium sp.]
MEGKMLAPAAVLVLWSLLMMLWMMQARFVAFAKQGVDLGKAPPGGRGNALEGVLPDKVNWKAHNFSHLMEQPTIFYPAVVILAIMGAKPIDIGLAWAYVGIRIVHSLWQATVNRIPIRSSLFFASSAFLIALAVRAVIATLMAA